MSFAYPSANRRIVRPLRNVMRWPLFHIFSLMSTIFSLLAFPHGMETHDDDNNLRNFVRSKTKKESSFKGGLGSGYMGHLSQNAPHHSHDSSLTDPEGAFLKAYGGYLISPTIETRLTGRFLLPKDLLDPTLSLGLSFPLSRVWMGSGMLSLAFPISEQSRSIHRFSTVMLNAGSHYRRARWLFGIFASTAFHLYNSSDNHSHDGAQHTLASIEPHTTTSHPHPREKVQYGGNLLWGYRPHAVWLLSQGASLAQSLREQNASAWITELSVGKITYFRDHVEAGVGFSLRSDESAMSFPSNSFISLLLQYHFF